MENKNGIPSLGLSLARDDFQPDDLRGISLEKLRNICRDVEWNNPDQQYAFERGVELAADVFCAVQMAENVSHGAISAGDYSGAVSVACVNPITPPSSDV
ncbi:hypothetical protein [Roseovarius pacificus]|uniref:hypothetical protein n=1 Tax=Roseovarius pacificus TaxID=337701 RepID=UPI004039D5AB